MAQNRYTRFTRLAALESDGLDGFAPRVGLADSANPGLSSSTPLGSLLCRATREGEGFEGFRSQGHPRGIGNPDFLNTGGVFIVPRRDRGMIVRKSEDLAAGKPP